MRTAMFCTIALYASSVQAGLLSWEIKQITAGPAQENGPIVYKEMIAWKDFRGPQGTDVWGYNLMSQTELPIVQTPGNQVPTALLGNSMLYETHGDTGSSIILRNMLTADETVIQGGTGSRGGSQMDGNWIVYVEGYATGDLIAYNMATQTSSIIANDASAPRISDGKIVWNSNIGGGLYGVFGYDLVGDMPFDLGVGQLPSIYGDTAVWTNNRQILQQNLTTGITSVLYESLDQDVSYATMNDRFLAWQQSEALFLPEGTQAYAAFQNVWVKDLLSGSVTQLTDYAPQQVSPASVPFLYEDKIAWMTWTTGNGDIYIAEQVVPEPSTLCLLLCAALFGLICNIRRIL